MLTAMPNLQRACRRLVAALVISASLSPSLGRAAESAVPAPTVQPPANARDLAAAASLALQGRQFTNAVELATQAISADRSNFLAWAVRGRAFSLLKKPALAIRDFSAALKLDSASASLYQARGEDHFRLGQFRDSVADFDRYLELVPERKPEHWQRGISCYYAGMFEAGQKQFELHQTVNAHDVENAVWHFLCLARIAGPAKARQSLIPIEGDRRVPMSQVHELFADKLKPADVLATAEAGTATGPERDNRMFYAHLYLGLYYEAMGDVARTREHIFKAVALPGTDHYMGDVARSHANVLRAKAAR